MCLAECPLFSIPNDPEANDIIEEIDDWADWEPQFIARRRRRERRNGVYMGAVGRDPPRENNAGDVFARMEAELGLPLPPLRNNRHNGRPRRNSMDLLDEQFARELQEEEFDVADRPMERP